DAHGHAMAMCAFGSIPFSASHLLGGHLLSPSLSPLQEPANGVRDTGLVPVLGASAFGAPTSDRPERHCLDVGQLCLIEVSEIDYVGESHQLAEGWGECQGGRDSTDVRANAGGKRTSRRGPAESMRKVKALTEALGECRYVEKRGERSGPRVRKVAV